MSWLLVKLPIEVEMTQWMEQFEGRQQVLLGLGPNGPPFAFGQNDGFDLGNDLSGDEAISWRMGAGK